MTRRRNPSSHDTFDEGPSWLSPGVDNRPYRGGRSYRTQAYKAARKTQVLPAVPRKQVARRNADNWDMPFGLTKGQTLAVAAGLGVVSFFATRWIYGKMTT